MRCRFILLLLLLNLRVLGQIIDNFSDGDFSNNPSWIGDVDDFIVNAEEQLQLFASDGGVSQLYLSFQRQDSLEWYWTNWMEFAPSASNFTRVYFAIDNIDITQANGYFLEMGENGTNDGLKLFELSNGTPNLIGIGIPATLAADPAFVSVSIKWVNKTLQIGTNYQGNNFFNTEIEVDNIDLPSLSDLFFLLYYEYISTRSDKFFFDDFMVQELILDMEKPTLVSVRSDQSDGLTLVYNEALSADNVNFLDRFSIVPSDISFIVANISAQNPNEIVFALDNDIPSSTIFDICAVEITDLAGNKSDFECLTLFKSESPRLGDIQINEILFDPYTGGSDFAELVNVSEKIIALNSCTIQNINKNESKKLENDLIIMPGQYLALTKDTSDLISRYPFHDLANLIEQDIPSFNQDNGNIAVFCEINNQETLIDQFNYDQNFHFEWFDNLKGKSLEKKQVNLDSNDPVSWSSANSNYNYATPGLENSTYDWNVSLKDIFINEVLFNPLSGGQDFVELINTSSEVLDLDQCFLQNSQNGQQTQLVDDTSLHPAQILAISADTSFLLDNYPNHENQNLMFGSLPNLNNDEGNISLICYREDQLFTIDSVDYNQDMHNALLDDPKGISLEKINPLVESTSSSSWTSASLISGGATPGYINANNIDLNGGDMDIFLTKKTFSPDHDGYDDLLITNIQTTSAGFIANAKIFTDSGFLVKNLLNNELLSINNVITWDGTDDEGLIEDIGIYIILIELFDTHGNKVIFKDSFVLAKSLE